MRRRLEAILTIVAAIAVFAAAGYVIVHKDPVKDAGQTPGFSLATTSSAAQPSGSASASGSKPVVFFLGDDWTAGAGASSKSKGFVALLSTSLPITAKSVAVADGGYAKSSDAGKTYLDEVSTIVAAKPDLVVVTGGRNDTADDTGTLRDRAKKLFAMLHTKLPAAKLIAVAPFWGDSDHPDELGTVDSAVKNGVQAAGGTYLDLADPLHNHANWMATAADPNDKGYAAIATALSSALTKLLPST